MRNTISTSIIALQAATGAPEWLHVLPAGTFKGIDGRGPYVVIDAAALIALFVAEGRKLPIDENHSTDLAGKKGFSAPARGWIVELDARTDGLWGKVEWTAQGRAMVEGHDYGYLSPVFEHTAKAPFNVTKMLRVALTNDPNLNLTALHSQQENTMDLVALRKALGLPETADDAAIIAAATAAHTANTTHVALIGRVAEVAGVTDTADTNALVAALQAKTTPASKVEAENASLKDQIKSLNSKVETLVTSNAQEKAVATVDAAIAAGKVVPALRDHMISRHSKNPTEVEAELKLMPSINAGGLGGRQPPVTGETASADELKVAAMMGVDPTAYSEQHKSLFGKGQ